MLSNYNKIPVAHLSIELDRGFCWTDATATYDMVYLKQS